MGNKNSKGLYTCKITYEGRPYYLRSKTKQGLAEKVFLKKQELEAGCEALYNPTLNNYYETFTEVRRSEIKESTIRSQKHQYELIAGVVMPNKKTFGEMHIKDITRRNIEDVRLMLLHDEIKPQTPENLNNCFAHLNHVFNNATLDGTIEKNPCKALKQLKRTAPLVKDTKHRALTLEETAQFFEVAEKKNSYYINIFKLMLRTGMRVGEVCALYQTDIDTKNGFIHVRKTVTKSEAGAVIIGDNTKTKSGNRDIPLTSDIKAIIKDQEELNRMIFGFGWNGLLFKSIEGDIMREYQVNREIKRICKEAGIEAFSSHAFRNTFATRFIEQRPQDYKILSEILGHKDVSISLNLYTHVMTENKTAAMNEIIINFAQSCT